MVLVALVAAAVAAPQFLPYGAPYPGFTAANTFISGPAALPYATAPFAVPAPVAYSAPVPAPVAYAGPVPAPLAYPVPAPVAYAAPVPSVPAPVAYQTGAKVINTYKPVEQHGYSIAY